MFLFVGFREEGEGEGREGGEREKERERERNINLLFHVFIHSFVLVCVLTWDQTCNLGV